MDKDRIADAVKQIKGSVKETVGKAVGDAKLQSDGKTDVLEGKVQNAQGRAEEVRIQDRLRRLSRLANPCVSTDIGMC